MVREARGVGQASRVERGSVAEEAKRRVAEAYGVGYIHDKFSAKAKEIQAQIEAGEFDDTAQRIELGVAMTDSPLNGEANRLHDEALKARKVRKGDDVAPLTSEQVAAFETDQMSEYQAAIAARDAGRKAIDEKWGADGVAGKKIGVGAVLSGRAFAMAKQAVLERAVQDLEPTEYIEEDELFCMGQAPGMKELANVLASKGYQVIPTPAGSVWKFEAVKMEAAPVAVETAPKTSYTPAELQEEIQRALEAKDAARQVEADAAELVRLKAASAELAQLKNELPGMIEKAVDKAVEQVRREEQRVHDVLIAMYGQAMPREVVDRLKGAHANGDAS